MLISIFARPVVTCPCRQVDGGRFEGPMGSAVERLGRAMAVVFALSLSVASCGQLEQTACLVDSECAEGTCVAGRCVVPDDLTDSGDVDATTPDVDLPDGPDVGDDVEVGDAIDDTDADVRPDAGDAREDTDFDTDVDTDVDVTPTGRNACGGLSALVYHDEEASPGVACGAWDEGRLVCAGIDALYCRGALSLNACGGTGLLSGIPNTECGCGGTWVCDAESGDVECVGSSPRNLCSGCDPLNGRPGYGCFNDIGVPGIFVCASDESLVCSASGGNACEGTDVLRDPGTGQRALPGQPCAGACGDGVLACDGGDSLRCVTDVEQNECGGCSALSFGDVSLGDACGACGAGAWVCDGEREMSCEESVEMSACGRCSPSGGGDPTPGEACPLDGADGYWVCEGTDVVCVADLDPSLVNACGGTGGLDETPGDPCGACAEGVVVCASTQRVSCSVSDADQWNACGGCGPLAGSIDHACGECARGSWACASDDASLICDAPDGTAFENACGGCIDLGELRPETWCNNCLTWVCADGGIVCAPDDDPACEGFVQCEELDCDDDERTCVEATDTQPARCGACRAGFIERGGVCVAIATCESLNCGAVHRQCLVDGVEAACGGCLEGYNEVDGHCVLIDPCEELACAEEHRMCVVSGGGASCGACIEGWEEVGGVCVPESPCTALNCRAENRSCLEAGDGAAFCAGCLAGYVEVRGACVDATRLVVGVSASDGDYVEYVRVNWLRVDGASGYRIFRNAVPIAAVDSSELDYDDEDVLGGRRIDVMVGVSATTDLTDRVVLSWPEQTPPPGPTALYSVAAVFDGTEGPRSEEDSGFRAGYPPTRYSIGFGVSGPWFGQALNLSYTHNDAPPGAMSDGRLFASDSDPNGVALEVSGLTVSPGPEQTYRVRTTTCAGCNGAANLVYGNRAVGPLTYRWERRDAGFTALPFLPVGTTSVPEYFDASAVTRFNYEYQVVISADGAATVTVGPANGYVP